MADHKPNDQERFTAGGFSSWLAEMHGAISGDGQAEVPCGTCTACCTSSQFVHIAPDETDTLSHIPTDLLFPAPRLPRGHVVLGYDERGHCPMLVDNQCSIYEHRPRTCRTYDCRIFPASGLEGDEDKPAIAQRARRWRFSFPTRADGAEHDAVKAAAAFLDEHRESLPAAVGPTNTAQRAALAIEIHQLFLAGDGTADQGPVVEPDPDVVQAEVSRLTRG